MDVAHLDRILSNSQKFRQTRLKIDIVRKCKNPLVNIQTQ
ncbi:7557_t:CDS:2 [Ambispora leptoticha]|uniref:7557_t:CDS:1 n=1 Tax=Ambispora leptoticha TaxID=144679 RepID=A0A9N8WKS8_9GLOM|nr:7557_t:CDS:2 [Ambispora leptoticha]